MVNRLTILRVLAGCGIVCFYAGIVWGGLLQLKATATEAEQDESDKKRSEHASSEAPPPPLAAVLTKYCVNCHGSESPEGDLDLISVLEHDIAQHPAIWERVLRKLRSRQMPPSGESRPTENVAEGVMKSLAEALDAAAAEHPRPGRTDTFRRLNRIEYQNAIRDLLHLDINAEKLLPADESSHGFDNVTVGDLPPALLTRYLNGARKISQLAIGESRKHPDGHTYRIAPDVTQEKHVPGLPLGTRGGILLHHTFPRSGEYEVHVHLARDRNEHVEGLNQKYEMEFLLDRERVANFTIVPPKNRKRYVFDDDLLKARIVVPAGPHNLGVTFVRNKSYLLETKRQPLNVHFNSHRHPRLTPAVYQVSITGPFYTHDNIPPSAGLPSLNTPGRRRIFCCYPSSPDEDEACAKTIISDLTRRAYRRPITDDDLARPMAFFREAHAQDGFETGIEMALSSILVSPRFLFRMERDPQGLQGGSVYAVSDLELASRISFFLWSSIPDDELLVVAERGELRQPDVLKQQMNRMLNDSRSSALVTNFASQWLYLRNLDSRTPDARAFPDFDDNLRQAFRQETEMFFQSILQEDRSVLDLLNADYTYLNERLARHYGIPHIYGSRFRRVEDARKYHRGGLLRHGSILTVTSYATRTSPVVRGHWILSNVLGTPTPPPPANVPSLEDVVIGAELPIRQRLALHRANAACASCHDIIDPIGFALENYDAVGRWRDHEFGQPVRSAGGLYGENTVGGVAGLEQDILEQPEMFVATLTEKLLIYALGRGIEDQDGPAVRQVVRSAAGNQYRFSEVVWGIINSPAFQMRVCE
ncbi:MAG: DUF1592 domain-containing protein [Fuerstiella sp.]|nr:DUF1592 domain-containing protein [Fuerstiella sp.]MCP4513420.1 DUF1592 domain-containing protein [Fuerstiella sp.]MDG2126389.1 DUF1592 domain-containing protein [Fuerstiella sp.]